MEMLTMERINEGLSNRRGVAGKIMNKREMESIKNELKAVEQEIRTEMDSFSMVAQFINGITSKDIHNTIEYVEAEVVGVEGQDISIGVADEDRVSLMYGTSHVNDGIRYTDSIDMIYGTRLY